MNSLNGGYAMIKYNSTQEELQIAYRSKKPVLCYDENRRAHWAVIEETATESVDEETQEPITIYEYSYRLIDEASGGGATLDDIVDSQGNKRFVEGSGAPATISGITFTYNKWSLSGTHLMLVCAGSYKGSTFLDASVTFSTFSVPEYIFDKIVPLYGNIIDLKTVNFYSSAGVSDARTFYFKKTNGALTFVLVAGGSIKDDRNFRIQFDLLIDAE